MHDDPFLYFRVIFTGCFFVTLFVGVYLFRNFQKLLGAHPEVPSETVGARSYGKLHILALWIHALILFGALALALH